MSKSKTPETIPFSLRLTPDEHATLKLDAAGGSMAALARKRLFGGNVEPRKTRGKFPVKDWQALGKVLGQLGASDVSTNLRELAEAARAGCLVIDSLTEANLTRACRDIGLMRAELMKALGVRETQTTRSLNSEFEKAAKP